MAKLEDAIAYLLEKYPHKNELSNARVTKMLYLADWYSLINDHNPITNITWYFDNYGPFVPDVRNAVLHSDVLHSKNSTNYYGQPKELFILSGKNFTPNLKDYEQNSIDHVIKKTKDLNWSSFIKLIYSTYPVACSSRYSTLDLKKLAIEYKELP